MNDALRDGPRNIVLLSDGTGNSGSSVFKTNVRRLYEALDLADPQNPKHPRQFAFYDDGVGTSTFRPLTILGGAFGYGLARNVRDIYSFLCRTYRPGDRIYGFGFSRGAFTIRIVIALILMQGIVTYDGNEASLERKVRAAYRAYRRDKRHHFRLVNLLRPLRDVAVGTWHRLNGYTEEEDYPNSTRITPGSVEFVGCWETVDAYGLPIEELTRAIDRAIYPLTLADADLHARVKRARHALALDEERQTFHPRLWNEDTDVDRNDPDRIRQVWFTGVHSDVGGGYPDDGLAHVTLNWMLGELKAADGSAQALRLRPDAEAQIQSRADENGVLHDSRRGFASYYRYRPRDIEILRSQEPHLATNYSVQIRTPIIHQSALRRIKAGLDGYAPISSTIDFRVVRVDGSFATAEEIVGPPERSSPSAFAAGRQAAFNFVWWRRICYFASLVLTLTIAGFPAYLNADNCSGWACFMSPIIQTVGGFLPAMLAGWTVTAAANPATLLLLLAALIGTNLAGAYFSCRITDEMRAVWYNGTDLKPTSPPGIQFRRPSAVGPVNKTVERLRRSAGYICFWNFGRRWGLPILASLGTLLFAYALTSVGTMAVRESWGAVCQWDRNKFGEAWPVTSQFTTNSQCAATGAHLREGDRYEIDVLIPTTAQWRDGDPPGMSASPNGLIHETGIKMALFAPTRRYWHQPWFKLMARVGSQGTDVFAPDWRLISSQGGFLYRAQLTSPRTGPLFLYVNDAVPLGFTRRIYGNNGGSAEVTVRLVSSEHHVAPR